MIIRQLLLITIVLSSLYSYSQEIIFEGGKSISTFDYKDSNRNGIDNLYPLSTNTYMSMGVKLPVKKISDNFSILIGTGFNSYGASANIYTDIDKTNVLYLEYDLNYLEFFTGVDATLFKIKNKTSIYMRGVFTTELLIQGTQTLDNNTYNLRHNKDFIKPLFGFKTGVGFSHPVSKSLELYAQYMYGIKLPINEISENKKEVLTIQTDNLGFGAIINLSVQKKSNQIRKK